MTTIDLLRWLGETSLALSILIILILIIRKSFAKLFGARAAYALWIAPAARLFLPELKLLPAPDTTAPDLASFIDPTPVTAAYGWDSVVAPLPANADFLNHGFDWLSLAAGASLFLWAAVAIAWFCFALETQANYMRARLAASKPASPEIAAMAQTITRQLRLPRAPKIRINESDDHGPCLIGLFRPAVFLPAGFETGYARAEQRLVLAHELAHVARGDMAATLAALALKAAQWPNPLAHLSFAAFRTDQEAACDAYVLARCGGVESSYAEAILKSVRKDITTPHYALALAHPVKERIMLLKSRKKSPARVTAGVVAVAVFTAASLAATASYGFADEKKVTKTITVKADEAQEKKTTSTVIITADDGESLNIGGVKNAGKIVVQEENGERMVKVYDKKGKLLTEDVYGPDDDMPYDKVTITDKKGEDKTISITGARTPHDVMLLAGDDMDFDIMLPPDAPLPPDAHGVRKVMVIGDDAHAFNMADCGDGGPNAPKIFEWREQDVDGLDDQEKTVTHEVICISDAAAGADPEARAEHLRNAIASLEESAKREAERREAMIARLKEQLKQAEQQ